MPHKTSNETPDTFEIDNSSLPPDYLGLLTSDDYDDTELEDDSDLPSISARPPTPINSRKRVGSSWQKIEALHESRRLHALLKEFYEE